MKTENINNYSEMSIEDLEKLKIKFLSQRDNIENIIGEIINNIRAKKLQVSNHALREHPYYKDNTSYLKVVINDGTGYTVTKITPGGKCMGIYQFNADNTNFLKYYKICSQSEWESAIDRLNIWFKDASLKIKKLWLDPHILDQINFAIIKEASKGNYAAWIGSILPPTNVDKYYNYLKELGFEISLRYKGEYGVYVVWC